jgi:histidine triad (HIT) family protein
MTQECKFCRIISRQLPASIVLEDDFCLAFLDHRPLFPGHCLLVPKNHHETLADLPDDRIQPLFSDARLLSRAVEAGMEADGTFLAINNKISQSVPHLHVHVVPRRKKDGLKGFFWPRNPYRDEEQMEEVSAKLRDVVKRLYRPL